MNAARTFTFLSIAVLLLAAGNRQLCGQEPLVVPVDGEPFSAQLQRVAPGWKIHFRQPAREQVISSADLVSWGTPRAPRSRSHILLADGGLLIAKVVRLTGDHLVISSDLWQETLLPLETVRAILLHSPVDPIQHDRWLDRIQRSKGNHDTLYLKNQDTVEGVLVGLSGISPERREPAFQMRQGGGANPLMVPLKTVVAVRFNETLIRKPVMDQVRAEVGFRDGSWLHLQRVTVAGQGLECELPGAIRIKTHAPQGQLESQQTPVSPWQQVTGIRPRSDRVVYLGDLQPVDYKHIPFLDIQWPFHVDRNVLGGQLRVAGRWYRRGIGMHSTARLVYNVPAGCDRFQVEVGIDDRAQRQGSVVFSLYLQKAADDAPTSRWERVAASPVMRGGQPVKKLSISLQDARRVALVVECADQGDQRDLANWLNPCFLRPTP
jgi:hypothetical protein